MAAIFVPCGKTTVTTAGTPVPIVLPATLTPAACHAFMIQTLKTNTGTVYIGLAGLNKTTLANVILPLPPPTTNAYPVFSASLAGAANAVPLTGLFVDADVNGEGVLLTVIVA